MHSKRKLSPALGALSIVACIALLALAATSCAGGQADNAQGKTSSNAVIIGQVCQGTPLAEAAPYVAASGTHPVAMLKLNTNDAYRYGCPHQSDYVSPRDWRASYVEDLELVLCIDEAESTLVETCSYTLQDSGTAATLSRYATQATVRLLEAQTGREIASETIVAEPRECQETEKFVEGSSGTSVQGPVCDQLEAWLRPHVEIP